MILEPAGAKIHQDAAHRAGETANADDRSDDAAREHVGGEREQVGGESLVRGGGHADQQHGDPFGVDRPAEDLRVSASDRARTTQMRR